MCVYADEFFWDFPVSISPQNTLAASGGRDVISVPYTMVNSSTASVTPFILLRTRMSVSFLTEKQRLKSDRCVYLMHSIKVG